MISIDLQVLAAARRWAADQRRFALVTIARTWGSAPRPPGSWLAVRDDGLLEGSVSGGCIEDDLIRRMRENRLGKSKPFTLTYGSSADEAARFGLPCGGTLELVVEPDPNIDGLAELAARLDRRTLSLRRIDLKTGTVTLSDARRDDSLCWDGERLTTVHGPRWRLLIVGAGQTTRYLAQMAMALDYEIVVCDPRREYQSSWNVPNTRLVTTMPDDAFLAMEPDARCAVVALTHDPKLDDMVLLEALKSPAFYIGALGSRSNHARRRERFARHFDLTEQELGRLFGPVGLPIGSRTPPEIAISILAEMTAVKNGAVSPLSDSNFTAPDTSATCRKPLSEEHRVERYRRTAAGCRK
jgi:xanthine dehydrogenase accessory factor